MLSAGDIVRADTFAKVLEYRIEHTGSTIAEACAAVGIPERTFYRWIADDNAAMTMVKETLNDAQRASLFEYSQRIYIALKLLLDDAVNTGIKVESRLKILKFAIPLFDEFAKIHHAVPGGEDQAPFLKQGPQLEHAQSRLATIDIGINEDGVKIDISKDQPVIDSTFHVLESPVQPLPEAEGQPNVPQPE